MRHSRPGERAESAADVMWLGDCGVSPYVDGSWGVAVAYPDGHVEDPQQAGAGRCRRAQGLDAGPRGRVLQEAAQCFPGPSWYPDRLDHHLVTDRAQPGALAGEELRRGGGADAGHPEQNVPQRVDCREVLVGSFPQVDVTADRREQAGDIAGHGPGAEELPYHVRPPGDIQQGYGQQIIEIGRA